MNLRFVGMTERTIMTGKYTLDDRINDLCLLENYIKKEGIKEGAVDVLCNQIQFVQDVQEIIEDMKNQIGASGEYMDKKLSEWIDKLNS